MRQPKKLKSQLIVYFTLVTIVSSSLISSFLYINSQKNLEENIINNANGTIVYITDNIEKQLRLAEQLTDWVFINKSMSKVFSKEYSDKKKPFDDDMLNFQDTVNQQLLNFAVWKYVTAILVEGDNGIDLRWGSDSSYVDKEKVQEYEWYKAQMDFGGKLYWYGIVKNPATYTYIDNVLPVVRPIIHSELNTKIGWSMINFKESLISDVFKKYKTDTTKALYLIDSNGICISSESKSDIGRDMRSDSRVQEILTKGNGHFSTQNSGENTLMVFHKSEVTGWILVQELSYSYLDRQKMVLFKTTMWIFLAAILVSLIFTFFLSNTITNPIRKLHRRLNNIADGNFERDKSVEGEDELGMLGKGINKMAVDIHKLMNRILDEESEKRGLEISMLQSQINPHFLYNTLNTIKWIAVIQKADGVRDAVSALGRLLRNTICDASEKITIDDEIKILDDYMYIQKLRYNGAVDLKYNIQKDSLLNCKILKLTLQPIVENAIFHGIEPKKSAGTVKINLYEENGTIVISVEDNGIGMTPERIEEIMSGRKSEEKIKGLSGVGIKNVDDRIKLNYGKEYGLKIQSVVGEYTMVVVKIPAETIENTNICSDS